MILVAMIVTVAIIVLILRLLVAVVSMILFAIMILVAIIVTVATATRSRSIKTKSGGDERGGRLGGAGRAGVCARACQGREGPRRRDSCGPARSRDRAQGATTGAAIARRVGDAGLERPQKRVSAAIRRVRAATGGMRR